MSQCTAKSKRTGERCQRPAIEGKSVCYHHGGKSTGRPTTHARYSKSLPPKLTERYEYFKTDPDILNLKSDLALARTMMESFMSTIGEAQTVSAETGGEMRAWLDQVSKVAERCHKILHGETYTLTVENAQALVARWCDIVNTHIDAGLTGQTLKDAIGRDIAKELGGDG